MEKLKEIYSNIRDRFTNPLVFSFVCAWIIINWKVTVALIWYNPEEIRKTGCETIFEFISDKVNTGTGILHPFYLALGYTLLMPIVKNLISAFYTWTGTWGENWNLSISKGGKIPIGKYFKLRENYDRRTKILEKVISQESELTNKNATLETELFEIKDAANSLKLQLTESQNTISLSKNVGMLNGRWTNSYSDEIDTSFNGIEEVLIENGKYSVIGISDDRIHYFNIIYFHFDVNGKTVFFIKERMNQQAAFKPNGLRANLRFNPNMLQFEGDNILRGYENGTTNVKYERKLN